MTGGSGPTRGEAALLAAVYVVPLLGAVVLLAVVGLPGLALALLAVEAVVSGATAVALRRRRPATARSGAGRRWLVPVALAAVLVAVVAVAVLGDRLG